MLEQRPARVFVMQRNTIVLIHAAKHTCMQLLDRCKNTPCMCALDGKSRKATEGGFGSLTAA